MVKPTVPPLNVENVTMPSHSNNYMLPLDSPKSPRPNKTVDAVALILERIIQSNEKYIKNLQQAPQYRFPRLIAQFDYTDGAPVTFEKIRKLIYNFSYRTRLRNETLVGAIVYLDRIVQRSGIVISHANYLLVIAMTLITCQKLYDDFHYSLRDYATVFGIPLQHLIKAEHAYLKLIRYDLIVEPDEYNQYREYIVMKFDATLRKSAPFSPSSSLLNKFELRGIASIKDVGEYMLSTIGKNNGSDDETDVAKNELSGGKQEHVDAEKFESQLPQGRF